MYAFSLAFRQFRPHPTVSALSVILALTALSHVAPLHAQISSNPTDQPTPSFGTEATAPISVITGKPYEAERILHVRRSLADGTIATHDFAIHEARDSSGRTLSEMEFDLPAIADHPSRHFALITVVDPASRTMLSWTNLTKTGTLVHFPPPHPPLLSGLPPQKPEDNAALLGHRMIHGLLCTGYSLRKTIPAGAMGNTTPITTRHEWWIDNDLHIKALEIFDDPQHGERTFELVSIKQDEPDPASFHLPSGYTVRDVRPHSTGSSASANTDQPLDLAHAPAVTHDEAIAMLASSQDKQRQLAGAAALTKEAQANPDPAAKDDIAYRLARAGVGLTEAKSLAEFAVNHAESDCSSQSAPVTETSAFNRQIALAHDWNTLGYIYERQHDTDHAKSYIESAWKLDPLAYYGFHLGRIAEQSGDTKAAIDIYRAALQAPGGDSMKASIRERVTALAGNAENAPEPVEETLTGAAPGLTGSALFDLTYVSGAGNPTAVFVSGSEPLRQLVPAIAQQESAGFTLPDAGPERVVRRFEVTCGAQPGTPAGCRLRALGAHEARALLHP